MIWFIGGAARCGKSTLMRQAQPFIDGQVLSCDDLKLSLSSVVAGSDKDRLFAKISIHSSSPQEWIGLLRQRDQVLWKFAKKFVQAAASNNQNAIVEGGLWPDFMADLSPDIEYRAVFLVDTSSGAQTNRLIRLARSPTTDNNWMRDWSDEELKFWTSYNIERSQEILRLSQKHNQAVFDISGGGLQAAQNRALSHLQS